MSFELNDYSCEELHRSSCKKLSQECRPDQWSCDSLTWAPGVLQFEFEGTHPGIPGNHHVNLCLPGQSILIAYSGEAYNFDKFRPVIQTALQQMGGKNFLSESETDDIAGQLTNKEQGHAFGILNTMDELKCSS